MTAARAPKRGALQAPTEDLCGRTPFTHTPLVAWKVHGAENDFLFFRADQSHLPHHFSKAEPAAGQRPPLPVTGQWTAFVEDLCQRRTGVGADGVVLWSVSTTERARDVGETSGTSDNETAASAPNPAPLRVHMNIWNADGSVAATCGNALRCLGLLLRMDGLWNGVAPLPVFSDPGSVNRILQSNESNERAGSTQASLFTRAAEPFATLRRAEQNPVAGQRDAQVAVDMGWPTLVKGHDSVVHAIKEAVESASASEGIPLCLEGAYQVELANPHIVLVARCTSGHSAGRSETARPNSGEEPRGEMNDAQQNDRDRKILDGVESLLLIHGLQWKMRLFSMLHGPVKADTNLGLLILSSDREAPSFLAVHERGAGVTRACGSGATAAALATQQHLDSTWSLGDPKPFSSLIHMPGGKLTLSLEQESTGPVAVMTGPAVAVAQVQIDFPRV